MRLIRGAFGSAAHLEDDDVDADERADGDGGGDGGGLRADKRQGRAHEQDERRQQGEGAQECTADTSRGVQQQQAKQRRRKRTLTKENRESAATKGTLAVG